MEYEKKSVLKNELDTFFAEAMKNGVFPGASVGIQKREKGKEDFLFKRSFGHTDNTDTASPVKDETFFDLASLTKPLVTVLVVAALLEKRSLHLDEHLSDLLPGAKVPVDKKNILLWQLMSHCSGLPAHRLYYKDILTIPPGDRKESVLDSILNEPLEYSPAEKHIYSDLGYMLLGFIIESRTGRTLQSLIHDILEPLGLEKQLFFPQPGQLDLKICAATENCSWTGEKLCGKVHDDNCRALGGVAGHAGLFGTVGGVLALCDFICRGWHGYVKNSPISSDILKKITRRVGTSTWTCGFDTPTRLYSSSGRFFSSRTIGHLGFTGTSFWIDLEREIQVVFLTNRVCPSRENEKIKRIRPKLHDIIMEKLI